MPYIATLKKALRSAVLLFIALLLEPCATASEGIATLKSKLRCGWFDNPTPANFWLTDRDGDWIIGSQGGHQSEGDWPEVYQGEWVSTNGYYGYGCACLRVIADEGLHQVKKVLSAKSLSLRTCRVDRALPKRTLEAQ